MAAPQTNSTTAVPRTVLTSAGSRCFTLNSR